MHVADSLAASGVAGLGVRCYCCGERLGGEVALDRNRRAWCGLCRVGCTLVGKATIARGDACPLRRDSHMSASDAID